MFCVYVCRCTCIHACHRKISGLLLTKAITQFIFFLWILDFLILKKLRNSG